MPAAEGCAKGDALVQLKNLDDKRRKITISLQELVDVYVKAKEDVRLMIEKPEETNGIKNDVKNL